MSDPNQDVFSSLGSFQQSTSPSDTVVSLLKQLVPSNINAQHAFQSKLRYRVLLSSNINKQSPLTSSDTTTSSETSSSSSSSSSTVETGPEHFRKLVGKKKRLSARAKKYSQVFSIPRCGITYDMMLPANAIWKCYFVNLVGLCPTKLLQIEQKLVHADLQGCMITVIQSTHPEHIGVSGIVLFETKNTLKIIPQTSITMTSTQQQQPQQQPQQSQQQQTLTISKRKTVFSIDIAFLYPQNMTEFEHELRHLNTINSTHELQQLETIATTKVKNFLTKRHEQHRRPIPPPPRVEVLLYGDQFIIRPYERITRKFKLTTTIEIHGKTKY